MQYLFQGNDAESSSQQLIIYFCGWGMTPASVAHMVLPPQYDLLSLYDYRSLEVSNSLETLPWGSYRSVTIVAWSLGVWAVEQLIPRSVLPLPSRQRLIAVAGSPYPMHDRWGIPQHIFKGTLEGLTEENRKRFNLRMCGGAQYKALYEIFSERSTQDLRTELQAVYDTIVSQEHIDTAPCSNLSWDLAIVGERDLIFPAKNLIALWQSLSVPTQLLTTGYHYLFDQWRSWEELLITP